MISHSRGRVIKFDLKTRTAKTLLPDLAFPNGIVYEKRSNSLYFSEFNRYRIWKHNLTDGTTTFLIRNLFGSVDNIKLSDNGDLLLAIVLTRDHLS